MTLEFLLISFIIVATPGIGVVYTLAAALSQGPRVAVLAAFACTLGIVPHLVAAMLGIAALLYASALLFNVVKYAGAAYLLYMAWSAWREGGALSVGAAAKTPSRVVIDGILVNILNPKPSLFFVVFLPQFIVPDEPAPIARMLELSGVFMLMTFVIFALYGLFAAAMRDQVISRPAVMKWIRRTFAATFVALGAKLALTER